MLLLIVAAVRTIGGKAAKEPDRTALIEYIYGGRLERDDDHLLAGNRRLAEKES